MTMFPHFAGILAAGLTVASAAMATEEVRCVQQALLDGGFDPNGVDGTLGNGTRAAAEAYGAAVPSDLPPLEAETAGLWCRALGLAPEIRAAMEAVCAEEAEDLPGMTGFAGAWFEGDEAVLPYAIFIEGVTGAGKIKGYYATALHDGWMQARSCVAFIGSITEDGGLRFFTGNNGRVERVIPGYATLPEGGISYLDDIAWISRYGDTTGWAVRLPAGE